MEKFTRENMTPAILITKNESADQNNLLSIRPPNPNLIATKETMNTISLTKDHTDDLNLEF